MALLFLLWTSNDALAQSDPLIEIMSRELDREYNVLSRQDYPVYYMDYQIWDTKKLNVSANLGSLFDSSNSHSRNANGQVRVGDYQLDNTHDLGEQVYSGYAGNSAMPVPLDNNEKAIAHYLWTLTNLKHQQATEEYKRITTLKNEGKTPDFSKEDPSVFIGEVKDVDFLKRQKQNEDLLKRLSALFLTNKDIASGTVSLTRDLVTKYFVSTEGTKIVHQQEYNTLSISAQIQDNKGVLIPLYRTYFSFDVNNLPGEAELRSSIEEMIQDLVLLQTAPLAEPYSGPAILHPRVTGVFFHEIFGHRIEGSRLTSDFDSQTFKEKVGEEVLPKTMHVYMDPTVSQLNDQDLIGHFMYDDEGVKGRKVTVVKEGKLTNFLMTRKPLKQFTTSNGHARSQAGFDPVSRQSNLIVDTDKKLSSAELRKQLIKECKRQNKRYGYYFKDVQGGFTNTDRFSPNAFNIIPTLVYRIYVDGRPDELVRGVDLIGTPLSMFAEISAAGKEVETFNGYCGAESGSVPVSATAPELLVRRIETQKQYSYSNGEEAPILKRPVKQ